MATVREDAGAPSSSSSPSSSPPPPPPQPPALPSSASSSSISPATISVSASMSSSVSSFPAAFALAAASSTVSVLLAEPSPSASAVPSPAPTTHASSSSSSSDSGDSGDLLFKVVAIVVGCVLFLVTVVVFVFIRRKIIFKRRDPPQFLSVASEGGGAAAAAPFSSPTSAAAATAAERARSSVYLNTYEMDGSLATLNTRKSKSSLSMSLPEDPEEPSLPVSPTNMARLQQRGPSELSNSYTRSCTNLDHGPIFLSESSLSDVDHVAPRSIGRNSGGFRPEDYSPTSSTSFTGSFNDRVQHHVESFNEREDDDIHQSNNIDDYIYMHNSNNNNNNNNNDNSNHHNSGNGVENYGNARGKVNDNSDNSYNYNGSYNYNDDEFSARGSRPRVTPLSLEGGLGRSVPNPDRPLRSPLSPSPSPDELHPPLEPSSGGAAVLQAAGRPHPQRQQRQQLVSRPLEDDGDHAVHESSAAFDRCDNLADHVITPSSQSYKSPHMIMHSRGFTVDAPSFSWREQQSANQGAHDEQYNIYSDVHSVSNHPGQHHLQDATDRHPNFERGHMTVHSNHSRFLGAPKADDTITSIEATSATTVRRGFQIESDPMDSGAHGDGFGNNGDRANDNENDNDEGQDATAVMAAAASSNTADKSGGGQGGSTWHRDASGRLRRSISNTDLAIVERRMELFPSSVHPLQKRQRRPSVHEHFYLQKESKESHGIAAPSPGQRWATMAAATPRSNLSLRMAAAAAAATNDMAHISIAPPLPSIVSVR